MDYDLIVIGAGIFGMTAALELQRRGYTTAVFDPGPIPHPLAASTDISKVIRMEYGTDADYMAMMETARQGWLDWNAQWETPLYHETGVTMLSRQTWRPGDYEFESYNMLLQRRHHPERLTAQAIAERFPAWKPGAYVDGFYHAKGGYAESGKVVAKLVELAVEEGVRLHDLEGVQEIVVRNGRWQAIRTNQATYQADHLLVAAGAWTPYLVPDLKSVMKVSGHPVFHLKPANPELFTSPNFAVFTADITHSGWYGFPLLLQEGHPHEGVVKIANHGVGQVLHPTHDERVVTAVDEQNLRHFLANTFPALLDAPIVYTRRCLYCDTLDEHFWIDRHPDIDGVSVAAGGSGHGFKFAPILGNLIADAVEQKPNEWLPKFAWRTLTPHTAGQEAARYHG